MNKISKFAIAILVVFGMILSASSAFAAATSDQGSAHATIVKPLTLSCGSTDPDMLQFGEIVADATGGTVAVALNGTTVATDIMTLSGGQAGKCNLTGKSDAFYDITGPTTAVTLTKPPTTSGGTDSATMSATILVPASGQLDANMIGMFNYGGTLTIGNDQMAGTYWGTFPLSVIYQ